MLYHMRTKDKMTTIAMSGRFTYTDHAGFHTLLGRIKDLPDGTDVVFDLSRVEFADSAALGMLVIANDLSQQKNQTLTIRHPREQVCMAFEIAAMSTLLKIEA